MRIKDYNWEGIIAGFVIRADIEGSTFTFAFLLRTGDGGEQVDPSNLQGFFGFANETGEFIIIPEMEYKNADLQGINKAIGAKGSVLSFKYARTQERNLLIL